MDKKDRTYLKHRIKAIVEREHGDYPGSRSIFAKKIGVSTGTVNNWISEKRVSNKPTDVHLQRIADTYGYRVEYLRLGIGAEKPTERPEQGKISTENLENINMLRKTYELIAHQQGEISKLSNKIDEMSKHINFIHNQLTKGTAKNSVT